MGKHIKSLIKSNSEISTNYRYSVQCINKVEPYSIDTYLISIKEDMPVMVDEFHKIALECGRRLPQIGDVYIHFKGMKIYIVDLAYHTETKEPLVIYKHGDISWARPLSMFLSKVDKEKYPDVKQYYRLERELPLNVKDTIEFKEIVFDLIYNVDKFGNMSMEDVEDYVLKHYYL